MIDQIPQPPRVTNLPTPKPMSPIRKRSIPSDPYIILRHAADVILRYTASGDHTVPGNHVMSLLLAVFCRVIYNLIPWRRTVSLIPASRFLSVLFSGDSRPGGYLGAIGNN